MKKHLRLILKLSFMISMILLFFGAWSIHWQESINKQIFWDSNRIVAGLGFLIAVCSWGFWEFFASSKTSKPLFALIALCLLIISTIMINGAIGLTAGIISSSIIGITYYLDAKNILTIRKGN